MRIFSRLRRTRRWLRKRLRQYEEDRPDGPISGYLWLWRALERESTSRLGLRIRFAMLVLQDATLLVLWAVAQALARAVRSRYGWPTVAATAIAAWLLVGLTRDDTGPGDARGAVAPTVDHPGSVIAPMEDRIRHARMEIIGTTGVRFEGQFIPPADLPGVLTYFDVQSATVHVDSLATARMVNDLSRVLVQAGVARVEFTSPGV